MIIINVFDPSAAELIVNPTGWRLATWKVQLSCLNQRDAPYLCDIRMAESPAAPSTMTSNMAKSTKNAVPEMIQKIAAAKASGKFTFQAGRYVCSK